jgi:hypothetical protein
MKRYLFFSIVFNVIIFFSCCQHRTFCILFKDFSVHTSDRISSRPLNENDSVKSDQLAIDLKFEFVRNKCIEGRHTDLENDIYNQREDTLLNIQIVSNADFDLLHKSGTVLNDLFLMPDTNWFKKFNAENSITDLSLPLLQSTDSARLHTLVVILEWNHNVTMTKVLPTIKLLK